MNFMKEDKIWNLKKNSYNVSSSFFFYDALVKKKILRAAVTEYNRILVCLRAIKEIGDVCTQATILARTFGTLPLFKNQNKAILPPPPLPLNNVGCQDSNMSRKSCSVYRLQHCLGKGGGGGISF